MAERTTTAIVMSKNTQESMRKKLEEWRKTKSQTASSKPTPFKQTDSKTKLQAKRSDIKSARKSMPYRASSVYRLKENNFDRTILKRKSFSASTGKKCSSQARRPVQKTAETSRVNKTAETAKTNSTNDERFSQNPPQNLEIEKDPDPKKARRSTFTKEVVVFHENPPSNFEIETKQDENKARRSTFTLDSPAIPVQEKKEKQPNLSEPLEAWKKEKRSQTKPNAPNKTNENINTVYSKSASSISSKPQVKPSTHSRTRDPIQTKSFPTGTDMTKKVPPRKSLSAIYRQNNNKILPKRNDVRKTTCSVVTIPKKTSQATKQHANTLKKPANHIKKTPSAKKVLSAKTTEYLDKSKSLRERLELWRKEKGKTPKPSKTLLVERKGDIVKKPEVQPIPLQILSPEIKDNSNKEAAIAATDENKKMLKEFHKKIDKSNLGEISCQLDEMQKADNDILQLAEYWLCRVKIAQVSGDQDRILCLYQQAIAFNAQPLSLIKDEMSKYESQTAEAQHCQEISTVAEDVMQLATDEEVSPCQQAVHQKQPISPHQAVAVFTSPSSTIRYSVTKGTPYKSRLKTNERPSITPVRRSVRLERRSVCYPSMLQDHSLTVKHLDELPQGMKDEISFRPNFAVQSELNDAWKEIMDY